MSFTLRIVIGQLELGAHKGRPYRLGGRYARWKSCVAAASLSNCEAFPLDISP